MEARDMTAVTLGEATPEPTDDPTQASDRRQAVIWWIFVACVLAWLGWKLSALNWALVWRVSPLLWQGYIVSCLLTLVSVALGMVFGIGLAAARMSRFAPLRYLSMAYTETVRATPQLMVIFWIFFTYPVFAGHNMSPWTGAVVSLTMIASAYLAEVIRGGLLSVPKIQSESATVIGLSRSQTFIRVLLPQACRNMLPAFITTLITSFKVTSLVYVIGLIDFFRAASLINNRNFAPATLYTVVAIVYLITCFALSRLVGLLDPKYKLQ
jgi:His/Glu/Gln/Arg/opine family amino acid ABC transporter permease subunit